MGSLWRQFGRFNLVGLLGAVLQLLVYRLIMRRLDLPVAAASAIEIINSRQYLQTAHRIALLRCG